MGSAAKPRVRRRGLSHGSSSNGCAAMIAAPAARAVTMASWMPSIDRDVPLETDSDGVSREVGIVVVVGQLEPGQEEEVVVAACPLGFVPDLREIVVIVLGADAACRRLAGRPVVRADDVVGEAEDVEPDRTVDVDDLPDRERTVTPAAVRVQFGEQGADPGSHVLNHA